MTAPDKDPPTEPVAPDIGDTNPVAIDDPAADVGDQIPAPSERAPVPTDIPAAEHDPGALPPQGNGADTGGLGFWKGALALGNTFGAILSLISFPSALVALYFYHAELLDLVSEPDLTVVPNNVSIRCFPFDRNQRNADGTRKTPTQLCQDGPTAVSFKYDVTNNDQIARRIEALRVTIDLPGIGVMELSQAYDQTHMLMNRRDYLVSLPWRFQDFEKGSAQTREAAILPADPADDVAFSKFHAAVLAYKARYGDQPIDMDLTVIADGGAALDQVQCSLTFTAARVKEFLDKNEDARVALTGRCI